MGSMSVAPSTFAVSMRGMNAFQANLCLVCVTLCWSTEVIIYACIPESVSSFATACISSFIGAALLFAVFFRRIMEALRAFGRMLVGHCAVLGALNFILNIGYIEGLRYVHVETGAFACIATAVFTPVLLALMHRKVGRRTWASVALIGAGIVLVIANTLTPGGFRGLPLIAVGCLSNALYIIKLGDYARQHDPIAVSALYLVFVGGISLIAWFVSDPRLVFSFDWSVQIIACLFLHGYFVTAFATVVNSFANARTSADSAAIIYSIEILFTVIWGVLLPPALIDPVEPTPAIVAGCALVVAGNLIVVAHPAAVARALKRRMDGSEASGRAAGLSAEVRGGGPDAQAGASSDGAGDAR